MLNPGPPPENITVGAGPPLPQMKTSSRLVLHCNILNTYSFSRTMDLIFAHKCLLNAAVVFSVGMLN